MLRLDSFGGKATWLKRMPGKMAVCGRFRDCVKKLYGRENGGDECIEDDDGFLVS